MTSAPAQDGGGAPPPRKSAALPRGVWVLGLVSLFMDMSSEIVHSLLPLFLVTGLGASMVVVGLIEGFAEATAGATKLFSGALSDYWGKRKGLTLAGYGLAAAVKPLFPLATGPGLVFAARFLDRIGKGIRGAPRDALIADITPEELRGAGYGLRQALDTVGALVGPLLATVLMVALAGDLRAVMWVAVLPALLSVTILALGVREPPRPPGKPQRVPLRGRDLAKLGRGFWVFIALVLVLMLTRYSEAFLLLRANGLGLEAAYVPLVLATLSLAYAASSYPAGRYSDRVGRKKLVVAGFALLAAADGVLAFAPTPAFVFAGAVLWGGHLGLTQGVLSAMVADVAPAGLRGTGFGVFHLTSGLALLVASVAAGLLWEVFGPSVTFLTAGVLAAAAVAAFALLHREANTIQED